MNDAALLQLTHWLSPVFPVGGYAYSGGLETAIADGLVSSEDSLLDWMETLLAVGTPRTDAILLVNAMAETADLTRLSSWAEALAGSDERWQEISEQGQAFARGLADMGVGDGTPFPLPVAVGCAAQGMGIPPSRVTALYLQSMLANMVVGAVRHIPLGQAAGSRVIAALQPSILALSEEAIGLSPEDAFAAAFGADLSQMRHETQETRIFRT